jgi:Transposase IS66 family
VAERDGSAQGLEGVCLRAEPPMDLSTLAAIDLGAIPDAGARTAIRGLLNLVEQLVAENRALREEVQQLRDALARAQGEQGRPKVQPHTAPARAADYSSERQRRQPKDWQKAAKVDQLVITRTERLAVDPATLPPDAEYKGTERVVVQDLKLEVDTVCFEKEVWYLPSEQRSVRAVLPAGYEGEFGPGIKALALALHYGANVTEAKLLELFRHAGVLMSTGYLAGLLSGDPAGFAAEARAVERAGLASSPWQHLDDTGTRVDGRNWYCHVFGNGLFSVYRTTPKKDRLTVLEVLSGGQRQYLWNAEADVHLEAWGLTTSATRWLTGLARDQVLDVATAEGWLDRAGRGPGAQTRTRLLEALAIAAYHAQTDWPMVECLVCDDAAQFRLVTDELALCWVHEGRHYTKLTAHLPQHRTQLATFRQEFWTYYRDLLAYRVQPTAAERTRLQTRFETLFTPTTGFQLLDERIALTRRKQHDLLRVLDHPELPLHNNPAELAARRRVRKRDASFGPRSAAGRAAWDTFHTLAATTQQLGVSFYAFLKDRLTHAGVEPPLARLLSERASALSLGASWAVS